MKFWTWPLEVRIVAIAWVLAVLAAMAALVLLRLGVIERGDDAFAMVLGIGLTGLLIFELLTWNAFGIGFFHGCLLGAVGDPEFLAKAKQRFSWRNNPLARRKR
jgi:hypothetical protein